MKHINNNLQYSEKRRGRSLGATGKGPLIQLGIAIFALVVVILAVIFLIVPLARGAIDWDAVWLTRTPAPEPAAEMPAVPAIISSQVQMLSLDADKGEAVLVDPAISGGTLLYASGPSEDACERIVRVDLSNGKHKTLTPVLQNDCLRMPRESGDHLVWFDAKAAGGGSICYKNEATGSEGVLVELSACLPALYLDGPYLVFQIGTGLKDKLYVIDLESGESVTLAVLEDAAQAASAPAVKDGRVCYAGKDGVHVVDLAAGTSETVETAVFVHDPRPAGDGVLWLSGNHGEDCDLYYEDAEGETLILAKGVIDARAAEGCAVYGRDGTVYAYSFAGKNFYMLSGAEEYAQLVAAGGDYALWRVLSNGDTVYRYLKVN